MLNMPDDLKSEGPMSTIFGKLNAIDKWIREHDPKIHGDVVGPSVAGDGNLAVFDGVTGKLIKDGGAAPTGSIPAGAYIPYGGAAAPAGWLLCDGTSYLRADYPDLFTAIGTTYGFADATHFNVPDMRGRVPIGAGTGTGGGASGTGKPTGGSALTAVVVAGWKGEETHVLTVAELAAHTHTIPRATGALGTGNEVPKAPTHDSNINSGSSGSNTAHNNIQPVMGGNFIIKT